MPREIGAAATNLAMKRQVRQIRRVVRILTMIVLVVVPASLLVLWMMFQHKPAWYRVPTLDEAALRNVRVETSQLADRISEHLVHKKLIVVSFDEARVNRWLASLHETWPGGREALPREVDGWVVSFAPTVLNVGGHYNDGTWRAIISAGFDLRLSDDGRSVIIALQDIRGGSLAMPEWGLHRLLGRLRGSVAALSGVETVDQLRAGVVIRNRFVWPNGKRPLRIGKIKLGDGAIELTLEPL